mgnify:FL=1|tara:strand:+ start:236 stop:1198 length:963 start_codon:yes stop_codon:yes gene_type:complete
MKYGNIAGLENKISKLIMGNDNQTEYDSAAKLWDHWIEVGGNAFDTAHIYGGGSMESLLGRWMKERNNRSDLTIIAKGAHTPNCNPESISKQLNESLDRLQIDTADIYIMHRDNPDYPADEFMDVLNQEKSKNRIKIFGGSNWNIHRFKEANLWAQKNNKSEMTILNNNLALAQMINPLWAGCISSNDKETLDYLKQSNKSHMSWSSQARGYFLDDNIVQSIEDSIAEAEKSWRQPGENCSGPLSCYESDDNRKRKQRANEIALKNNLSAHNVAAAWTINQSFSSFALVGPRKVEEIDSTLPCLDFHLDQEQIDWLNLVS